MSKADYSRVSFWQKKCRNSGCFSFRRLHSTGARSFAAIECLQ